MKNLLKIILGSIMLLSLTVLKAQNCNLYMPLVTGTIYEYQMYDDKDKPNGSVTQKINSVATSTDGSTTANITATSTDKKDKEISTATMDIKCDGNNVYFDLKSMIPPETMKQWKDMDIKAEGAYMEIPQTLTEGMTINDGAMTINVYNQGTLFATMKVTIFNRKVEGTQTVTTPTGTYIAYKVTSDIKIETIIMGMSIPVNTKSAEYFAAGVGVVKSESFNKSGKLLGYQLLSKISK
jgi:hypothetical protein